MSMRTHFQIDNSSFASNLVLLVITAGLLNTTLFERTFSDAQDKKVLYRIELVINAERLTIKSSDLSTFLDDILGNNIAEGRILSSHFYGACFDTALFARQSKGQVNNRPFYSSRNHISSFNIPHQNFDEDEALILPVGIA